MCNKQMCSEPWHGEKALYVFQDLAPYSMNLGLRRMTLYFILIF